MGQKANILDELVGLRYKGSLFGTGKQIIVDKTIDVNYCKSLTIHVFGAFYKNEQ